MLSRPSRIALLAALLTILAFLAASPVTAFSSMPPGRSIHERITGDAAEAAGFPEQARDALRAAVIVPDLDEMEWDPDTDEPARVDARGAYRGEHHCDRVPPQGDAEAFDATAAFVQQRLEAAVNASRVGDPDGAVTRLGYALHAAQDCASHSDAVDLGLDGAAFAALVLGDAGSGGNDGSAGNGANGSAAGALRLTGFEPGTDDPEMPAGDPYPHGTYAKDSPDGTEEASLRLPDNRTKYEAARDLAQAVSEEILRRFLAELGPEELRTLATAEPTGDRTPKVDVPALPPLAAVLVSAALAVALARRR